MMVKVVYEQYDNETLTKGVLDTIKRGDLIKCNDWKQPLRVMGTSENFVVSKQNKFGSSIYSILEKRPAGYTYNAVTNPDQFRMGPDNMIFGWESYEFEDETIVAKYLEVLESGEVEVSQRNAVNLYNVQIQRISNWKPKEKLNVIKNS